MFIMIMIIFKWENENKLEFYIVFFVIFFEIGLFIRIVYFL